MSNHTCSDRLLADMQDKHCGNCYDIDFMLFVVFVEFICISMLQVNTIFRAMCGAWHGHTSNSEPASIQSLSSKFITAPAELRDQ